MDSNGDKNHGNDDDCDPIGILLTFTRNSGSNTGPNPHGPDPNTARVVVSGYEHTRRVLIHNSIKALPGYGSTKYTVVDYHPHDLENFLDFCINTRVIHFCSIHVSDASNI